MKKHQVCLTRAERRQLLRWVKTGKRSARSITRAHILLMSDRRATDQPIVHSLHIGLATVERTRRK